MPHLTMPIYIKNVIKKVEEISPNLFKWFYNNYVKVKIDKSHRVMFGKSKSYHKY